jgi:pimeloyl-ACP methyl ester carboxylesterase
MPEEIIRSLSVDGLTYSYRMLPHPRPVTEPVLIVGGVRQGMYGWPQLEDRLCPDATFITADLPGMGDADPPRPEHDSTLMCVAIEQILDDLRLPRVNLFGYSYGAALAFACAQRQPDRVARLLIGGVPARFSAAQRAYWTEAVRELCAGRYETFATMATEGMLCMDPGRYVHRRRLAYRYVRRLLLHHRHTPTEMSRALTERLPLSGGLTGVTTLVFSGEHDTLTTPQTQCAFAATIADSTFVTLPDGDHWIILERGDEVAALAHRFFTSSENPAYSAEDQNHLNIAPSGGLAPDYRGYRVVPGARVVANNDGGVSGERPSLRRA